jgi:D-tyrosyl-tRNA(Tyr) deacylase
MRILLQRVTEAAVHVRGATPDLPPRLAGRVGAGYLLLVGFTHGDTAAEVQWMVDKVLALRLFPDDDGKLNRDLRERGGALLVVSQFTLYADARKGRRPGFTDAAPPDVAQPLYNLFVMRLRDQGVELATGEFGADMAVSLVNDGPVTLWLTREPPAPAT